MGIYLTEQASAFLQAVIVGAFLGLFYDAFRISRLAFRTSSAVVFVEDMLFFVIAALVTFFFGLTVIDGALRVFLIVGELLGGVIYFLTLGRLVMRVSKKIIDAIKAIIRFLFRWILNPVWRLFYHIITFILKPFRFLSSFFKKKLRNAKFRLKVRRKVLYNQLKGIFNFKKAVNKPRGRKNDKKQKDKK